MNEFSSNDKKDTESGECREMKKALKREELLRKEMIDLKKQHSIEIYNLSIENEKLHEKLDAYDRILYYPGVPIQYVKGSSETSLDGDTLPMPMFSKLTWILDEHQMMKKELERYREEQDKRKFTDKIVEVYYRWKSVFDDGYPINNTRSTDLEYCLLDMWKAIKSHAQANQ